ncbi:MAG: RNA-metabolising metallo-beta-lactamase, metallo-beta-lactamase family protein [Candidatus Nomurabacteria bacterium]|nr:RNA-metabolising metallo-beta-lactamase, metallo-beta-lactamase family protein [Candidatus Nomurabacteria bacterium]
MSVFKITFYGGAQMPTGSNFLVEFGGKKVLIDCGLVQGEKYSIPMNRESFKYDTSSVDMLFVTHGHLDHVGRIPVLVKAGFKGIIASTEPTREIAELIMLDSMGVLGKEAMHTGEPPLYEEKDVLQAIHLWSIALEYEKPFIFKTKDEDAIVTFHDSGHILGGAIIEISYKGEKIAFTGDLGNTPSPLMKDTTELKDIDYLVMESVYGDRNHKDKDKRIEIFKEAVVSTINKGGTVLIPAFSIERTQEILLAFNELVESKQIPEVPVYLDSPLGINITRVYKKYESWFNENVKEIIKSGDDIFAFKGLVQTLSPDESRGIASDSRPKVIIAGSGMSNGGRILFHEAKYLPDPNSTIIIVGYQSVNTLGRRIVDGAKEVMIHNMPVKVNARLVNIHGFSAHKDSDNLVAFVSSIAKSLKKVFIVLGEPKSSFFLGQRLHEEYGLDIVIPERGDAVELG